MPMENLLGSPFARVFSQGHPQRFSCKSYLLDALLHDKGKLMNQIGS